MALVTWKATVAPRPAPATVRCLKFCRSVTFREQDCLPGLQRGLGHANWVVLLLDLPVARDAGRRRRLCVLLW